ncbi:unnamed protein product [Rotaria sp. Silwood1]|nr:unnamed protein product [Rotaria sp. Silwood1]CAF3413359.1 unnamed protein product [Rotaria sp. Silwood1]CAF3438382.1 unnamed protein product [Rotaria sp. Silwood1]CAF3441350.1 unnamed protein product [Rotaria sp. Silwood1]CAF3455695.1 unnamed protein product [Rotaria sp. Silwood1]
MASATIELGDFTCSICREIFENPVSLSCLHSYCQSCLSGLRKPPSTPSSSDTPLIPAPPTPTYGSLIYRPKFHETNQCFVCAICRTESFGYSDCRDLEVDLKTLEGLCPHCSKPFMLCNLRKHLENCTPPSKPNVGVEEIKKIFTTDFFKKLSQPQAEALQKARAGENRSTFQCPYCPTANFTVEHLCEHIEENHLDDDPRRVCPICATMPWGDRERVSTNVYQHILGRHRFNYETYVNYEQDEDTMIAEAVERSMFNH